MSPAEKKESITGTRDTFRTKTTAQTIATRIRFDFDPCHDK